MPEATDLGKSDQTKVLPKSATDNLPDQQS